MVSKTFSVGSIYNNVSWTVSSNASLTTNNNSATIVFNNVGTYTIAASASKDNDCYKGSCYVTIDYIPNFTIEKKCNSVIINNKSQYLYPTTVTCTIKNANGNTISTFSFPSYQTSQIYTFASSPSGTYYFEFSCNGHNCPAVEVTFDNTPSNLSITTSNPATQNTTCDNTPITLTLNSNGIPLNNTNISWKFGDQSIIDTNQSSIDHTFEYELEGMSAYHVVAITKDANGCPDSATVEIFSYPKYYNIEFTPEGTDTCQGIDRIIKTNQQHSEIWDYLWSSSQGNAPVTDITGYNNIRSSVKYTNNYYLKVQDYHYCKREAIVNVGFKNLPYASIAMQGNKFCKGDKIQLSGKSGADDTYYTYQWSVTDDNGNSIAVDQTGITSFTAENVSTYYISLHITDNSSGCESDIAQAVVSILK